MAAARSTIANMISSAVVGASSIAVRSGAMEEAPALRIDHHRRVKCPDSAVFRISGRQLIKLLSQVGQVPQSGPLVKKLIGAKASRKQACNADQDRPNGRRTDEYFRDRIH
ncbi:hypothetical protein ACVOMS_04640 [Bradyrhizobium guangxiense]